MLWRRLFAKAWEVELQPAPPAEPPSARAFKRHREERQQMALADSIQKAVADGIQARVPQTGGSESFVVDM